MARRRFQFLTFANSIHRAAHEDLIKAHKLLVVTFRENTKRQREVDCDHNAASPLPYVSKPLLQSDYPQIKFWKKKDWKDYLAAIKDTSPLEVKAGPRGGTRAAKGENVSMKFVEDEDGNEVDGTLASDIRDFARAIWREFQSQGNPPETWGSADRKIREEYYSAMEEKFEVLRYCDNNWKSQAVATSIYSQWYHSRDENPSPGPDEPPKKKAKKRDAGNALPSQPQCQPEDSLPDAPTPATTGEGECYGTHQPDIPTDVTDHPSTGAATPIVLDPLCDGLLSSFSFVC